MSFMSEERHVLVRADRILSVVNVKDELRVTTVDGATTVYPHCIAASFHRKPRLAYLTRILNRYETVAEQLLGEDVDDLLGDAALTSEEKRAARAGLLHAVHLIANSLIEQQDEKENQQ